jgi:hypothetical protein
MATKNKKTTKVTRAPRVKAAPRPQRPFLRPSAWIALAAVAAVGVTMFFLNRQSEQEASATPTPGIEETFVFEYGRGVTSIEVAAAEGDSVRVERNAENAWVLTKPERAEANPGAVEAAASQIGSILIITAIENAEDPANFGLDAPAHTITVEFEDGVKSILEVGDLTPSGNGYYLRVDAEKVFVVSASGIDALTSLLIFPPYLNTPTPSPTATFTPLPTETPDSATQAPSTPEATATP